MSYLTSLCLFSQLQNEVKIPLISQSCENLQAYLSIFNTVSEHSHKKLTQLLYLKKKKSDIVNKTLKKRVCGLEKALIWASRVALVAKNLPANAGDIRDEGLIPGFGRSPGEGHGNPLQYILAWRIRNSSCLSYLGPGTLTCKTMSVGPLPSDCILDWAHLQSGGPSSRIPSASGGSPPPRPLEASG